MISSQIPCSRVQLSAWREY